MKSVSLATIFWYILISSSETRKEFLLEGCHCDCPPYKNISKRIYGRTLIQNDCNCLYVVDPMPVPRDDAEAYCLLCDCKQLELSNTNVKIILIIFLSAFVSILLFKPFSMVVKRFIHKPDVYIKPLHNEEESDAP